MASSSPGAEKVFGEVAGGDGGEVDLQRSVVGRGEAGGEHTARDGQYDGEGEQDAEDPGEGFEQLHGRIERNSAGGEASSLTGVESNLAYPGGVTRARSRK